METTREPEGLLDKIRPPRLEDAGLEDCALPPESIQEAFLKAAAAVKSRASSIFSPSEPEPDSKCVNDPWPTFGKSSDTLVGVMPETEPPGSCTSQKGGGVQEVGGVDDVVVIGGGLNETVVDEVVGVEMPEGGGEACVDGLQGLEIEEKGLGLNENKKKLEGGTIIDDEDEERECESRPILIEGFDV